MTTARFTSLHVVVVAFCTLFQAFALSQGRTGTITGQLVLSDGKPAAGIRVSAISDAGVEADRATIAAISQTDGDGRYRIENLSPGRYFIIAGALGSPTYFPGTVNRVDATPVDVGATRPSSAIDFRVARTSIGLTVSGRVIRDAPLPLSTAEVVTLSGGESSLSMHARVDGTFEFPRVFPGPYRLSVEPGSQFRNILVREDDLTGIELLVPWTEDVKATVKVENGGPRPTFKIALAGGPRGSREITLDNPERDGETTKVPEGEYGLAVTGLPSGYYLKSITQGKTDLRANPLRVSRHSPQPEIVISLGVSSPPPWVKVSGRVLLSASVLQQGSVRLSMTFQDGRRATSTAIRADGSFEFPAILPDTYQVSLEPLTTGQVRMLVVPNADLKGVEIPFRGWRQVSGRITVADGAPLPRLNLKLESTGVSQRSETRTNSRMPDLFLAPDDEPAGAVNIAILPQVYGTFDVTLPEGEYRVTTTLQQGGGSGAGYSLTAFSYGTTDLLKTPLIVSASDTASLQLGFSPPTRPRVSVRGRVVGVNASAIRNGSPVVTLSANGFVESRTAAVAPDGTFEFSRVYPGSYRASVTVNRINAAVPVEVGDRDVTRLEIAFAPSGPAAPAVAAGSERKEVAGRIVIDGPSASMTELSLALVNDRASLTAGAPLMAAIQPRPDGTLIVKLPFGEWRAGSLGGLPPDYSFKSLTFGNADLARDLLRVSAADPATLTLTLKAQPISPVKVSGRVHGLPPQSTVTVVMRSAGSLRDLVAAVGASGAFEFPEVLPGRYTARVVGTSVPELPGTAVVVADRAVTAVDIVIPQLKEVAGRVTLTGDGPLPRFTLRMVPVDSVPANAVAVNVAPARNGTFRLTVPEGEYRTIITSELPAGYTLSALRYGATEIGRDPMKVALADNSQLDVRIAIAATAPASVSGRVSGIDLRAAATISMTATAFAVPIEAPVKANGTFEFAKVLPGTYTLRVTGPNVPVNACSGVRVFDTDIRDVEITAPQAGDDIKIISAIYGAAEGAADVTPMITRFTRPGGSEIYAAPRWMEVEPARGQTKSLAVSYLYRCEERFFSAVEPGAISYAILQAHADPALRPSAAPQNGSDEVTILSAYYGLGQTFTTITPTVRDLIKRDGEPVTLNTVVGAEGNRNNVVIITYSYRGIRNTYYGWTQDSILYSDLVEDALNGGTPDKHSSVPPAWLKDVYPDPPREPGDPGPGFGRLGRREVAIVALLKAIAELDAIPAAERTAAMTAATAVIRQALTATQANTGYPYPPANAKPVVPAQRIAARARRLENAAKNLATALNELNNAGAPRDQSWSNAVTAIRQAQEELGKIADAR